MKRPNRLVWWCVAVHQLKFCMNTRTQYISTNNSIPSQDHFLSWQAHEMMTIGPGENPSRMLTWKSTVLLSHIMCPHDWTVYKISSVLGSIGHHIKTVTRKITPAVANERGDIVIKDCVVLPDGQDNCLSSSPSDFGFHDDT